jgi:SHS2 domain-containing protein
LDAGEAVPVNADIRDEYGATRDEAFSNAEAAVKVWVTDETSP